MAKQKVYISNNGRRVDLMREGHFNVLVYDRLTQQVREIDKKWFYQNYKEIEHE